MSININQELNHWKEYISNHNKQYNSSNYYITLIFEKYNSFYALNSFDNVSFCDFKANNIKKIPREYLLNERKSSIQHWYSAVLKALFGINYHKFYNYQPFGIGYLDEPSFKKHSPDQFHLHPGTEYPHAHILLSVPETATRASRTISIKDKFNQFIEDGTLEDLWRKTCPEGQFHITDCYEPFGALSYSAKTAKFDYQSYHADYQILLPYKKPKSVTFH